MSEKTYLSPEQRERLERLAARYPQRRSITLPALWAVQRHWGHVSPDAAEEVADFVGITPAQVREVVTFYSMFREEPVGRYLLSVCGTLSCAACGGEGLIKHIQEKLNIERGQTTPDGLFALEVVECLGACAWAPAMLVNEELHVCLTRAKVDAILEACRSDAAQ